LNPPSLRWSSEGTDETTFMETVEPVLNGREMLERRQLVVLQQQ